MYFDVLVIGAGPAGLAFSALAADIGLSVAVFDRQSKKNLADPQNDGRDIAIAVKSQTILQDMGAWDFIPDDEISPIRKATVIDGDSPFTLNFDPENTGATQLGNIVSNHLIKQALHKVAAKKTGVTIFSNADVVSLERDLQSTTLVLKDGSAFTAPLAIAADTRFSKTRRDAGIKANMHDFGHTMIVGRMRHTKPHNHIARECFRYDGGLAVLPLNNNRASVVQTFPADRASQLLSMDDQDYVRITEHRLGGLLGELECEGERIAYPLVGVYARRFYAKRFALIGDAAVGMHPVTAHGFNFGIQGIANLVHHLSNAKSRNLDIGNDAALKAYDRDHRRLTWPLYQMTEKMIGLYTTNTVPARIARKAALHAVEVLQPAKDIVMAQLTNTQLRSVLKRKFPALPRLPRL